MGVWQAGSGEEAGASYLARVAALCSFALLGWAKLLFVYAASASPIAKPINAPATMMKGNWRQSRRALELSGLIPSSSPTIVACLDLEHHFSEEARQG
jgi:hypothetical protein